MAMEWVLDNWAWLLLGGGMIAMHLFGHGAHGDHGEQRGHDGHGEHAKARMAGSETAAESRPRPLAVGRGEKRDDH